MGEWRRIGVNHFEDHALLFTKDFWKKYSIKERFVSLILCELFQCDGSLALLREIILINFYKIGRF